MLSIEALNLLRLLRRWAVGSIAKFSEEIQLPPEIVEKAANELVKRKLISAFDMTGDCPFHNKMLEINDEGLNFLEMMDGPVDTFQDKVE